MVGDHTDMYQYVASARRVPHDTKLVLFVDLYTFGIAECWRVSLCGLLGVNRCMKRLKPDKPKYPLEP